MQKDCSKQKFFLSIYCKDGCLTYIQNIREIHLLYWEVSVPTKESSRLTSQTL